MSTVGIVAWAQSKHAASLPQLRPSEMVHGVVSQALDHAGLEIGKIDAVIGAGDDVLDGRSISNVFVVEAAGGFLKEESKVEEDGAFAAAYAWMRLAAGSGETALVYAYSKPSESGLEAYSAMIADPFFLRPLGVDATISAALAADAYARRYGVDPEAAARVAARSLASAGSNPNAVRGATLEIDEIVASPRVAGNLGEYDLPARADGACALILATESFAAEHDLPFVAIEGVGWATDGAYLGHRCLEALESARRAGRAAYSMAGLEFAEPGRAFEVAELSPISTYHEMMLLEALGFAEEGQGGRGAENSRGANRSRPSSG